MEGRHVHRLPRRRWHRPHAAAFTDYLVRLMKYVEFMKVVPLPDDLFDSLRALPG
jgi:hydrogenase large subunit